MGATLVHDLEEIVHAGSDNFFLLMPNSGNYYSVSGSSWINWGSNCVQGMSREFDNSRLMKSVVDSGFAGIVAIEYEGKELGPVEGVKATKALLQKLNRK